MCHAIIGSIILNKMLKFESLKKIKLRYTKSQTFDISVLRGFRNPANRTQTRSRAMLFSHWLVVDCG